MIDTSQFSGLSEASYARVFEYTIPSKSNKYIMLLMGNHGGTRKIYLAWSNDGRNWDTQTAPLITPNEDESGGTFGGGQLSAPFFFPWEGGYYVVYHAGSGNIHITEVGENFNLENHLGVLYDSTAIDNNRAATPFLITEGDTIYLFYTQGARLASNIAYATAHLSGSSAHWSLIDDDLDNYTQEWSISGTTGSVTQNNGYVTIVDDAIGSSGSYFFMTKKDFTAPAVPFTFEVRAKANAANTMNEITVRSGSYLISLYLTYGISGTAQNEQSAPSKSYTLDTTVYHNYRIVVHSDYTYDLYVDGNLAWSGAPNLGSGSDIFRIGGANTTTANMDVDYVRLGNGVIHV